jgi:cytochrome bd ubiquinol oxidase subunit II
MSAMGDVIWQNLPLIFAGLMGLSILVYVILDGFDLGVGILFASATPSEKDRMIGSIGPFWDANETWLVLAIGILLVAFPVAHGQILTALYLPVAVMLIALIMRGVAFEFRAKAGTAQKPMWNLIFFVGSALTALSQGFMLGAYVLGLRSDLFATLFALAVGLALVATYAAIGGAWLIYKAEGELQRKAVRWTVAASIAMAAGMAMVSIATPLASPRIFDKWFSVPEFIALAPLPVMAALLFSFLFWQLAHLPDRNDRFALVPFAVISGILTLGFCGLAYSFFPYIVPDRITIEAAASARESLAIILAGVCFVLPVIIGYSVFAYRVFGGKASDLSYD